MTYEKKAMTAFAQATVAACDLIEARFANTRFTGAVARVVKIEAPFVESTGGGRQARESIVLKAANDDAAHNVTAGFVDVGLRSCELRSYDALNLLFRQRFGRALDLHQSEYDRFAAELKELLEREGFAFKVVEADEQRAKADAVAEKSSNAGVMVALGVVAAIVVIGIAVVMLLR
ncbi:MAG: hypothetical protein IT382_18465 [Deltaproteobacteria bacterium]|nr:hypothetical protein [Deltaproteobacteria bacterium]